MKILFMKQWNLLIVLIFLCSCRESQQPVYQQTPAGGSGVASILYKDTIPEILFRSELDSGRKVPAGKIFTDTVTFVERNEDGDYFLFYVRKKNRLVSLVYDDPANQKREFLRGDTLAIRWKMDSIWIAGEGDQLDFKEWLVDVLKIKDSKVADLRKSYTKPLRYWYSKDTHYSEEFKDYLYRLVEYYIAYSKQPLVLLHLQNPGQTDFVYSIEERQEKGRHYIVLGLSNDQGTHSNIIQWLYLDPETHEFYEYDLVNDKLTPFS